MESKLETKRLGVCKKCNKLIQYNEEDTFWDYSGSGYNTKLVKCPDCGCYIILGYENDRWFTSGRNDSDLY